MVKNFRRSSLLPKHVGPSSHMLWNHLRMLHSVCLRLHSNKSNPCSCNHRLPLLILYYMPTALLLSELSNRHISDCSVTTVLIFEFMISFDPSSLFSPSSPLSGILSSPSGLPTIQLGSYTPPIQQSRPTVPMQPFLRFLFMEFILRISHFSQPLRPLRRFSSSSQSNPCRQCSSSTSDIFEPYNSNSRLRSKPNFLSPSSPSSCTILWVPFLFECQWASFVHFQPFPLFYSLWLIEYVQPIDAFIPWNALSLLSPFQPLQRIAPESPYSIYTAWLLFNPAA